ncbi:MAG: hypothetical protein WCI75_05330 [candidate division NC10 bacterium]
MGSYLVTLSTVGVMALGALSSPVVLAAEEITVGEVIIEATALSPEVLLTAPEGRVIFVNRSGWPVHLQFMMKNGGQHHLVQVPEQIWAVFHRVGRHAYEVHFDNHAMSDLHGAVEVVGDPYGGPDPLVCSGITVQGACLER